MDEIKYLIEKQKSLLTIILLGFITLVPLFVPSIEQNPKLWYFVGWLFWVTKLTIDKVDRINLAWNRFWLWITNGSVYWTVLAEFDGQYEDDTLDKIYDKVQTISPEIKVWSSNNGEKVIKLPIGGAIRLNRVTYQSGVDELKSTLRMDVSDFAVPFRDSEMILENLVSIIENGIKVVYKPLNEKYVFKVSFGENNPYFGLFIKRFRTHEHNLISFRVELDEKVGLSRERVDISASKLTVTTHSLTSLQKLSRKYVTLSDLNAS